jgi:cytochrome c-type biogenesis protein CcmH/NrfG
MLKDSPPDLAAALYRLGFAYAKMERAADATKALTDAAQIAGPYQPLARDLLAKIRAASAR